MDETLVHLGQVHQCVVTGHGTPEGVEAAQAVAEELGAYRRFRNSLIWVGVAVSGPAVGGGGGKGLSAE